MEEPINSQSRAVSKALVNIGIIVGGMIAIYLGFTAVLGTTTPLFVVSSGSMVPNLEIGDIIVVSGNTDFNSLQLNDIIVFEEPGYGSKVIVHRVVEISDSSIRRIVTKGDHNVAPDDWRVTSKDYIGKVVFVIPKVGLLTTALAPPINYIVILIVIVAVFMLEIRSQRSAGEDYKEKEIA